MGEQPMKMLVIVFRESLVEQVHALLNDYEVSAFSELHNVAGKGAPAPPASSFWPRRPTEWFSQRSLINWLTVSSMPLRTFD